MRQRHKDQRSLPVLKFVGAALIAGLSGACSSDVARFADSPFANPFNGRADTATTGSINAPLQSVRASSLGMPKPASSGMQSFPGASVGETGQVVTSVTDVAAASPVTSSVGGWTASGGTPVMLRQGDTIEALSGRYGVPTSALRQINGLSGKAQPSPGQQLIIPAYNPGAAAKKAATTTVASSAPRYQSVTAPVKTKAETLASKPRYLPLPSEAADDEEDDSKPAKVVSKAPAPRVAPRAQQPDATTTAAVKAMKAKAPKKIVEDEDDAQPMPRKGSAAGGFKPVEKSKPVAALKTKAAKPVDDDEDEDEKPAAPAPKAPVKAAKVEAPKAAEPVKTAKAEAPKAQEAETTGSVSTPEFRWPARGRVILGYGSKGPSGANEGINIALPEGTPIKASEGGTVAYAGEEIRGYGKMVLVRHANGFVSAYAHNGELAVKRGDVVKRGQVIARSGQSGNVTSPQLHFELRKGSEPVDPTRFLEGN